MYAKSLRTTSTTGLAWCVIIFRLVCADADADVQWDKEKLTILPWISAHPLPPFVPEA